MPKIFVSYSRADKARVKKLIPLLREVYGHENVWWDEDFVGGHVWWAEILKQIARCDVFLYIMSPRSIGSPYCQAEYEEATRIHKPILPVKVARGSSWIPEMLVQRQYIDLSRQINRATIPALLRAINEHAAYPSATLLPLTDTPVSVPNVPVSDSRNFLAEYAGQIVVAIIAGVILAFIIQADRFAPNDETPTNPAVAQNATDAPSAEPTLTVTQTSTITPTETAVLSETEVEGTIQAEMNAIVLDNIRTAEAGETATAEQARQYERGTAAALTLTATQWTATPTVDTRATAEARLTETQAWIDSWTPTPTPTISPEQIALTPQTSNADWTPFERDFDGVTMVLVPAGCFMMGTNDSEDREQPVHQQCFDDPFWIDKTEVTNAQYGSSGRWSGDDLPREMVTWSEAHDFCELRTGRLPTEAEWEYAARGPDGLVYPWGNEFIPDNVVFFENSNSQTALVGSRPNGGSWVGALDMSGNVWEWTLSEYRDYPYDWADGRENTSSDSRRVVRGGSWYDVDGLLRAADRVSDSPSVTGDSFGFRCVRPPSP